MAETLDTTTERFVCCVMGDSMAPQFRDGDRVWFDPQRTRDTGPAYVEFADGSTAFRLVTATEDGWLLATPDGSEVDVPADMVARVVWADYHEQIIRGSI